MAKKQYTLRDFQREDVEFIKKHHLRVLIANSQGTGKTPTTITAILETHRYSLPALVVCPASVVRNWCRETRRWAPGIKPIPIEGVLGPMPRPQANGLYVISWAVLDARIEMLKKYGFRTLVGDEIHVVKDPGTIRSQAFFELAETTDGLLVLSGTPLINNIHELQVIKRLYGTEDPPMLRRLLEDVAPDIPPKSRAYVRVQLRPTHRKIYNEANEDFENWLIQEREKLTAAGMNPTTDLERTLSAEALAKVGYLRRMVGRYKTQAAIEWISNAVRLGEPVVVFVEHQDVLHRITKGLKILRIRHGVVEGKSSVRARQAVIDGFQRHEFPVFIGTKAAKEGITLTAARHVLFAERYFTSAEEEQAEDRCIMQGQEVLTPQGWRVIESIKVGDAVITRKGVGVVTDAWSRGCTKNTVSIQVRGWLKPIVTTDDHKILLADGNYVKAEDVRPGFRLAYPEYTGAGLEKVPFDDDCRLPQKFVGSLGEQANGRLIVAPTHVELDTETLFVLGYFAGDGFASVAPGKGRFLSFSGNSEKKLPAIIRCEAWAERVGLNTHVSSDQNDGSGVEIRAYSGEWALWFKKHFGEGAKGKRLPSWYPQLDQAQSRAMLEGLIASDGYSRFGRHEYSTVSYDLAANVAVLMIQAGYKPCVTFAAQAGTYVVAYTETEKLSSGLVVSEVIMRSPRKDKDGMRQKVYDLTVSNDPSYALGLAVVHNCHRIGQLHKTTIWFLHAEDTIDSRIHEIVDTKRTLLHETIGLSDVLDTPDANVVDMLTQWGKHGNAPASDVTTLGLGDLPEPFPRATKTHAIFFSGERWKPESASVWCKMNGFDPEKRLQLPDGRLKYEIHPASFFRHGQFQAHAISKDIKIITGNRISADVEHKMKRLALAHRNVSVTPLKNRS